MMKAGVRKFFWATRLFIVVALAGLGAVDTVRAQADADVLLTSAVAEISGGYDPVTGGLCFVNGPTDLGPRVRGGLQTLMAKNGACHGMSSVVQAFRQNIRFVPSAAKQSPRHVQQAILSAVDARNQNATSVYDINGFSNLKQLCSVSAARKFLIDVALRNHLKVTASPEDIKLPWRFLRYKLSVPDGAELSRKNGRVFKCMIDQLTGGRTPLMLFPPYNILDEGMPAFTEYHVVMVYKVSVVTNAGENNNVTVHFYDPNTPGEPGVAMFPLTTDGKVVHEVRPVFVAHPLKTPLSADCDAADLAPPSLANVDTIPF